MVAGHFYIFIKDFRLDNERQMREEGLLVSIFYTSAIMTLCNINLAVAKKVIISLIFLQKLANRKANVQRKKSGSSNIDTPFETTQLAIAIINSSMC